MEVVSFLLFIVFRIKLLEWMIDVLVEWCFLLLFCVDVSWFLRIKYEFICLCIICLYIFDRIGNSDIGWLLFVNL